MNLLKLITSNIIKIKKIIKLHSSQLNFSHKSHLIRYNKKKIPWKK